MYQLKLFTLQHNLLKIFLYLKTAFSGGRRAVAEGTSEHGKITLLSR
jgi:hypothetical protein